jgi:hypothetical protein
LLGADITFDGEWRYLVSLHGMAWFIREEDFLWEAEMM